MPDTCTASPNLKGQALGHDWRLIDEKPHERQVTAEEYRAAGLGDGHGWFADGRTVRRWYCTRCRTIEETVE